MMSVLLFLLLLLPTILPFKGTSLVVCEFELGHMDRAEDELGRALILGGKDLFAGEDPKYFRFISTKLEAPPGGW